MIGTKAEHPKQSPQHTKAAVMPSGCNGAGPAVFAAEDSCRTDMDMARADVRPTWVSTVLLFVVELDG